MALIDRRVSRRFSTTATGGADDEVTHEVEEDATVEEIRIRFYPGPLLDLELRPFVETDEGRRRDLVDVIGRETIVGDDDRFEFHISEDVRESDVVGVEYVNNDAQNEYDFVVDMDFERAGGSSRIIDYLRGVF
ncbi:hypothetical protein [Salinigranum sp. GCM10025319]|uniref:hypothetical protein n=1 Tax=Salinigranum sp. GCM10025319 TaxID=3252687 RepID=UPI0036073F8B